MTRQADICNHMKDEMRIRKILMMVIAFISLAGCNSGGGPSSASAAVSSSHWSSVTFEVAGLTSPPTLPGRTRISAPASMPRNSRHAWNLIQPYTRWIRTFGSTRGLDVAGAIAHSLGLKAALGAYLSDDLNANERELQQLVAAGQAVMPLRAGR